MKTAILLLVLLPLAYNIHAIDTDEVIIKWNVRSSVEEFWAVVSNWSDSSWVKGTNGVTIDKNDKTIRTLHFFEPTKFDLTVKRYEYEPEKLKFTYGWEDQNGMKTYRGHVSLEPFGNEVMVTYRAVFAPSDESRRKAVKDGFTNQFQNGRVPWLQDKFKKTRSVTGLKWVSLSSSAIIDAPIDDVWKVQSPFDKMTEWYKSFEKVDIVSSGDIRNGTARECHVKGGKIVRETLVSMDPDTYTYSYHFIGYTDPKESPFGKLALENHRAVVTLTPVTIGSTSDSTLVRWSIDFYTDPTTVEVAKKANEFTFKALFDQLAAYFSNKKASSKTAVKLNKSGGIRQAALFPASITATRAWETMHSRDLADVEPLYSALLGTEGKHRRTYHGKFEGMKESVRVDHRYYVDSFTSEFGKGSSTGKRTVVRIDHGPFAKRSAIIFEDNVVGQDETQVANFANAYYNYVTKHSASKPNPCCALPCKNGGDCAATGTGASDFYCDCPEGWTGQTCTDPTFKQWLTNLITPSVEMEEYLRGNKFLMSIVNSIEWLSHRFMKAAVKAKLRKPIVPPPFDTSHPYRTVDGLLNNSYYSRLLPPVPANCPTPAGMVGPAEYPSSETIVERFLARKTFKKSSMYTSLLLAIYGQHFTHQFFKTTEGFGAEGLTYTEHYIDLNNVYGETLETQHMLREHKGGRMKMQTINGEDLPPYYKDVPVKTLKTFPGWETPADREEQLFALGHPFYSSNPGLVALSTIWLREHNRVAGLLQKEHPSWGDEQIFQTTRNILIVECFKITVEDYVGDNLAKGEFKFRFIPTLIQGEVQYQNRIAIEFNHLYHWHEFIPDAYNISGDIIPNHDFLFRKDVVLKHTPSGILDALSNQIAGEANGPNFDRFFGSDVARYVIEHGRGIRLQPLNRYRELVGLEPYTSFDQMVDDEQTQKDLKELYEHPDAVEMFPGMFIERRRDGGLFGATVTQRGIPSTFQGVFGHPLLSEEYWRPSTFGGEVGWEIVNGPNTLESLIRRNTRKWPTKEGPRGQMHTKDRDAALNEKKDL